MVINTSERVLGNTCGSCGALYLVDPTSKNVGEIMMQALGLAAGKLSKDIPKWWQEKITRTRSSATI